MTDIAIVWDETKQQGDWQLVNGDLLTGPPIQSAVLISLFTKRVLPQGSTPIDGTNDRGGYWGDSFDVAPPWGSLLWTLYRAVKYDQTTLLNLAKGYCEEALQWLVDDSVASAINVSVSWLTRTMIMIGVVVIEPDGTLHTFNYQWAWNGL